MAERKIGEAGGFPAQMTKVDFGLAVVGNGGPKQSRAMFAAHVIEHPMRQVQDFPAPLLEEAMRLVNTRPAPQENRPALAFDKADIQFVGQRIGEGLSAGEVAADPAVNCLCVSRADQAFTLFMTVNLMTTASLSEAAEVLRTAIDAVPLPVTRALMRYGPIVPPE